MALRRRTCAKMNRRPVTLVASPGKCNPAKKIAAMMFVISCGYGAPRRQWQLGESTKHTMAVLVLVLVLVIVVVALVVVVVLVVVLVVVVLVVLVVVDVVVVVVVVLVFFFNSQCCMHMATVSQRDCLWPL